MFGTFAAFTATTTNASNSISSGTVKIDQHAGSTSLYNATGKKPGEDTAGCVRITYTGSLPSMVRLYSTAAISNGSAYNLKVERGAGLSSPNSAMSCAGFAATATVYNASLAGFPSTFAGGAEGRAGGGAWAQNKIVDYRFTITPNDDTTANNHTAVQSTSPHDFTWEARNFPGYPAAVLSTSGLQAYWRLGEQTGNTAYDLTSSGNNHGSFYGGPTLGSPGIVTGDGDTSTTFDGTDDFVNLGNPSAFQTGTGTLEGWIRTSVSSSQGILHKNGAYALFLQDGKPATYDFGSSTVRDSGVNIADGNWHYVAYTFDSGVTNGSVIYIDGAPALTTTMSTNTQANALIAGAVNGGVAYFANGRLDELALYNRKLTTAEVKGHYDAGK